MSTSGENLLLAILRDKSIRTFLEVPAKHYSDKGEIALYNFIRDYYKKYSDLPTIEVAQTKFGYGEVTGKLGFYVNEVQSRYIYMVLGESLPKYVKNLRADPKKVLENIKDMVSGLTLNEFAADDLKYFSSVIDRYTAYEDRIDTGGVTYLSTGCPLLDRITFGYRKNDLWTIGGRAGTRKTWQLIYLTLQCEKALPESYGPIMLVSNEMGLEEIGERMDAIRYKLSYERLQAGELTDKEEKRYRAGSISSKKRDDRIIMVFNCSTLEELNMKIRIYQPSIVFLDGSYLLEPQMEEGIVKTTFITRNLKQIAKNEDTPIVNTTQLRKKTGKRSMKSTLDGQDEFFYGSYVQDSDLAIRTFVTPEMKYYQQIGMELVKARRSKEAQFIWNADLDKMEFNYEVGEEEIETLAEPTSKEKTDVDITKL